MSLSWRCLWNKAWWPYPALPPCKITHCVETFTVPPHTNLVEVTTAWTPVNTWKQYECAGKVGDRHTSFWQTDRERSTFEIFCKPDGYYEWREWPTCLEGDRNIFCSKSKIEKLLENHKQTYSPTDVIVLLLDITCSPEPPVIPSHSEYTLAKDDGWVKINSMEYPALVVTRDKIVNSSLNNTLLPRNYNATLE